MSRKSPDEEDDNNEVQRNVDFSESDEAIEQILANVHLTTCADSDDGDDEKTEKKIFNICNQVESSENCALCSCNGNLQNNFLDCYFKHEINVSNELLEESKQWLNGIQSVDKHRKENIFVPPVAVNDIDVKEEHLFTRVSSKCFEDTETCENDLSPSSLLNDGLELEEIDGSDTEEVTCGSKNLITSKLYFNSLPDEIKLQVFSFFTKRELCRFVAPVCLSWFHLAKDPVFWTTIHKADFADVKSDLLIEVILSWCKDLVHLELEERPDITTEAFDKVFRNCGKIQYISLKMCKQVQDEILKCISRHCKHLRGINLEGCSYLTDKSFSVFIGLQLESVSVAHCNQISDEGGIFLVRNFQCLRKINFDGIQWITDDFVTELVLRHCTTLKEVLLDGENITDLSIKNLAMCQNLRVLGLSFCHSLTYHSIDVIAGCTNLQVLKLRKGVNFTNESLLRYFEIMSAEQGVKFNSLNLAECTEITDECLFYLSEKCPNLEYLNLSWCWEVSDDGMAFIIDNCHKLKELHLIGLHELYGIPFVRVEKNNPELTFLDLSQCNKIKDEIITKLVNAMPELVAKDYYGDFLVNSSNTRPV